MQSKSMKFKFGNIHYIQSMTGKSNTLILLHPFHSSASSYQYLCDILKDDYNLICMDFPGHGLSSHIDCNKYAWYYSIDGFIDSYRYQKKLIESGVSQSQIYMLQNVRHVPYLDNPNAVAQIINEFTKS